MTRFRKFTGQIHLWLGLLSGLIVLIVSLTGCLFVFQKEILSVLNADKFVVSVPASTATLPISTLLKNAQAGLPKDHAVNFIVTVNRPEKAWEFMTYKPGNPKGLTYFDTIDYYESVFVNPYTGKVTGYVDYKYNFFNIVKYIHWNLLLNDTIGQPIVGYSTLIFVILLITGIIMWWPKKWSRTNINKSFKVKWAAGFKRIIYDLHNVSGFYTLLIALTLSLTGLVFALKWFESAVYTIASGNKPRPVPTYAKSVPGDAVEFPLDRAFLKAREMYPKVDRVTVSPAAGKEGVIYINAIIGEETFYHSDAMQFDQYKGTLLNRITYREKNAGEKLIAMNYDIHVGAVLGLPGKILAFIGSLIAASLPVTGFMIWLNRKKKKKKKSTN